MVTLRTNDTPRQAERRSGIAGARTRAKSLTAEQREAIAKKAAAVRWNNGGLKMLESERKALLDRFQAMKDDRSLRDMKFFLGKVSEATVEAVCHQVNKVYNLVDSGNFKEVTKWGDSNRPADA